MADPLDLDPLSPMPRPARRGRTGAERLLLFDLDGTLIRSFMREGGGGADQAYDLVEALPGRTAMIAELSVTAAVCGFGLVTNQGGVAFGYQTPEQVWTKIGAVVALFEGFGGKPVSIHVCMTHPKATVDAWRSDSLRRKPGCHMLVEAVAAHGMAHSIDNVLYVGDMDSDAEAAHTAGIPYMDARDFFA